MDLAFPQKGDNQITNQLVTLSVVVSKLFAVVADEKSDIGSWWSWLTLRSILKSHMDLVLLRDILLSSWFNIYGLRMFGLNC